MRYKLVFQNRIGSVEFSEKTGIVISEFSSFGAQNVSFDSTQSNRDIGEKLAYQSVNSKSISVLGTILGPSDALREQMKHVIAPLAEAKLIYNDEYELTVYVKKSPDIEKYSRYANFSFSLYAPYPYWFKKTRDQTMLVGLQPLFSFPWNISKPFSFSEVTDTGYVTILNDGEAPAYWTVTLSALDEVVNPRVYNMETGEYVKMLKTMSAGEQIILSNEGDELAVTCVSPDGEKSDGFPFLEIESIPFKLAVGENYVKTDAETNTAALRAVISFKAPFVGV